MSFGSQRNLNVRAEAHQERLEEGAANPEMIAEAFGDIDERGDRVVSHEPRLVDRLRGIFRRASPPAQTPGLDGPVEDVWERERRQRQESDQDASGG